MSEFGSVQGLATDQNKVAELEEKILPKIDEEIRVLTEIGIYRPPTYSVDKDKITALIAKALGDLAAKTPKGDISLNSKNVEAAAKRLPKDEAVAYVLVTDEDSIVTDYELLESEPTSMHGLVTGVTLLHRGLTG